MEKQVIDFPHFRKIILKDALAGKKGFVKCPKWESADKDFSETLHTARGKNTWRYL
jgi:hypothetical protein